MIRYYAAAAGSLVLLAVAVTSGVVFEWVLLVWLAARLARIEEVRHGR